MLLAIDCGNTNVVFAVYDGDRLMGQWRAATKTDRTSDEYGIWLLELMERDGLMPARITHAIVATILLNFGTGPIRGFAVTLLIGIITTLFCAVTVCKLCFDWYLESKGNKIERLSI